MFLIKHTLLILATSQISNTGSWLGITLLPFFSSLHLPHSSVLQYLLTQINREWQQTKQRKHNSHMFLTHTHTQTCIHILVLVTFEDTVLTHMYSLEATCNPTLIKKETTQTSHLTPHTKTVNYKI